MDQAVKKPPTQYEAILAEALMMFDEGEKIDMTVLAKRLGIGRATLYRSVGDRNQLLTEVMWTLNQMLFRELLAHAPVAGMDRINHVVCGMVDGIVDSAPFREFLKHEGLGALELITSQEGIRGRIIQRTIEMIKCEADSGRYSPPADLETLANSAVALGEYFLYAQFVVKGFEPRPDQAKKAVMLLFREA